jgi:hypothetical protein
MTLVRAVMATVVLAATLSIAAPWAQAQVPAGGGEIRVAQGARTYVVAHAVGGRITPAAPCAAAAGPFEAPKTRAHRIRAARECGRRGRYASDGGTACARALDPGRSTRARAAPGAGNDVPRAAVPGLAVCRRRKRAPGVLLRNVPTRAQSPGRHRRGRRRPARHAASRGLGIRYSGREGCDAARHQGRAALGRGRAATRPEPARPAPPGHRANGWRPGVGQESRTPTRSTVSLFAVGTRGTELLVATRIGRC